MNTAGKELINGSADHFLGGGRGGGACLSPLSNKNGSASGRGEEGNEDAPLHSSGKAHVREQGREGEADEEALRSELYQLDQLLSEHERRTVRTGSPSASQDNTV